MQILIYLKPRIFVLTWIGNGADVENKAIAWSQQQSGIVLNQQQFADLKRQFGIYYGKNLCNISRLYPNVKETLEMLKARGFILAVITNKPTKTCTACIKCFWY